MDDENLRAYIESVPWTTSKDGSHQYTIKHWMPKLQPVFESVAQHIRDNGHETTFRGKPYTVYVIDNRRYWTMGAPIKDTYVLNRAQERKSKKV